VASKNSDSHIQLEDLQLDNARALLEREVSVKLPSQDASATDYLQGVINGLCELSLKDPLTGLSNRRHFKAVQERAIEVVARSGEPALLLMLDIDHFKKVNDTYGHPAGDRVIKSLSRMLKQRLRETDMVGRYGGEEFAVILSNTNGETAANVLDAIRKDFAQLRHLAEGKEFSATFSCGIADVSFFADSVKLCDAADRALYKAKHAGRNQVLLAEAPVVTGTDFV
jgi:diguanylate cyclase (GGDEF)-like protein